MSSTVSSYAAQGDSNAVFIYESGHKKTLIQLTLSGRGYHIRHRVSLHEGSEFSHVEIKDQRAATDVSFVLFRSSSSSKTEEKILEEHCVTRF